MQSARYTAAGPTRAAEGWTLERLTPPSTLFGANGMRSREGRLYVAQVVGSQISAVDPDTGMAEAVSPLGGDIVGPDDLVFAPDGTIFATEVMNARVAVREPNGRTRVLRGDLPLVNGITYHQGRLFADESRSGGRVMELPLDGGEPKVLVSDLPTGNALEVGPDGKLYFPVMEANEIWRVDPNAGGAPEKVVGDLGVPDAVKFDSKGFIVSTQVATGEVLRINPQTGERTVLARLDPGLDNLTFLGERLFISSIRGQITEIYSDGRTRELFAGAFNYPLGLTVGDDGRLWIADGPKLFVLDGKALTQAASLFSPNVPGYMRGLDWSDGALIVGTANTTVARYRPWDNESELLAAGLEEVFGVAAAPGGAVIACDRAAGKVFSCKGGNAEALASGLADPRGVCIGDDGAILVSESGGGRVVKIAGGRAETVVDGLGDPQGVLVRGGKLYIVDSGAKTLVEYDLQAGTRRNLVDNLPVGVPPGVHPKPLLGFPPLSGPMGPIADIAAGKDGTLYISADAEGSIMAVRPG